MKIYDPRNYIHVYLLGIFFRWCVSLNNYSGYKKPPMYGDYEAQRHWQEITINLPVEEWYKNSSVNDLEYWGLDYPPLTAYHSFLCGLLAKYIDPNYVDLYLSRGYESKDHKLFMRYTVLIVDLLVFFPSAWLLFYNNGYMLKSKTGMFSCFAALILYPGLYLIDYGHFQYNCVSLGLFSIAIGLIYYNYDCMSAIFFTLALNYKQMELYHALPFFFYFLGKCFAEKNIIYCLRKLILIGISVILTFVCCWLPFISDISLLMQVIKRIFPVGRGLYEDKVASFWCSLSIFIKLKTLFDNVTMASICLITTILFSLPSGIHLLLFPKPNVLKYSLINISFVFFLFSFHVHEKSILLVTTPAAFVYSEEPLIVSWFFILSIISMLPLLEKDGLLIPTLAFPLIWYCFYLLAPKIDISKFSLSRTSICKQAFTISMFGIVCLTLLSLTVPPPLRYPDLYPVLISFYCSVHFCLFTLYFHYCQFNIVHFNKLREVKLKYN